MRHFGRGLLVLFLLSFGAAAAAQPAGPVNLTWVRFYRVAPDRAETIVRDARNALDPLTERGKTGGWGLLVPMTHIGDPWNVVIYMGITDWAAAEAIVNVLPSAAPGEVHDVVLRHVIQSETPPLAKPKYIVVNTHPIRRGRDSDAWALFNEWAKPIFIDLAAKGKIGPWGLSVQNIVLDNEWTYMVWYFLADLSALDDVHASLMEVGVSKLGTYERRLLEMSEDDYRGQIYRIVHSVP